tara:strand:- start:1673 stop:2347 length:675 start_codon:yes stop_codon:yes gene_type:complete
MKKNYKIFDLLFEEDGKSEQLSVQTDDVKARSTSASVDNQIDSLILKYESSAIRDEVAKVGEKLSLAEYSIVKNSLRYLFEQDEGEEDLGDEDLGGEDLGDEGGDAEGGEKGAAPDPVGSESMQVDKPGEELTPDLDIDAFTLKTIRLIENYNHLLNMKSTIINRVRNFLDDKYGEKFASRYIEILEKQFGIKTSKFDQQTMEPASDDIFAVGANPAGAGIGGG